MSSFASTDRDPGERRSVRPHDDPSELVIEVADLVKRYGSTNAVDGIGFRVRAGEIFGVLGANGAGKTTTVECLQGLRPPDAGQLRVLGMDPIADRHRLRSLIGSQLQDAALPERLRVREAIELFDRGVVADVDEHLLTWGLAGCARTPFAGLSGGQRQRLFIALALLNRPRVVFLDELTQGLDPAARREVWRVIRRVRDDGTTVVLVSHLAEEIEELCDRVIVMANGTIVDGGTPRELVDRHGSATVVSFTPPAGLDVGVLDWLEGFDAVAGVERRGDTVRVVGTSAVVAPACAASLDPWGHGPPDLEIRYSNLDDALVNLIGAQR